MEEMLKLCRSLELQGLINDTEPRAGYTETYVNIRTEVSIALRPAELKTEQIGRWAMELTRAMRVLFSLLQKQNLTSLLLTLERYSQHLSRCKGRESPR